MLMCEWVPGVCCELFEHVSGEAGGVWRSLQAISLPTAAFLQGGGASAAQSMQQACASLHACMVHALHVTLCQWIAQTVLEQGGQFAGINRKVQLKPVKWSTPAPSETAEGQAEQPRVQEALLILKHGGVLTHAGREQVCVVRCVVIWQERTEPGCKSHASCLFLWVARRAALAKSCAAIGLIRA